MAEAVRSQRAAKCCLDVFCHLPFMIFCCPLTCPFAAYQTNRSFTDPRYRLRHKKTLSSVVPNAEALEAELDDGNNFAVSPFKVFFAYWWRSGERAFDACYEGMDMESH